MMTRNTIYLSLSIVWLAALLGFLLFAIFR
jgi:hypothetical protein